MKKRLSSVSILLVAMALVAVGLLGCSRAAEERAPEGTELNLTPQPSAPSSGETAPAPGETVVSAVTLTPGAGAQPTQAPAGGTPVTIEPTATTEPGATAAVPTPAAPSGETGTIWHTVQQGETLSTIARRYGTTWQAIAQANGLVNPNQIYAGQKLKIPASSGGTGSTGSSTTGCRLRHTVKPGEWVWQIARNYGTSPYDILAANGLTVQTANVIYAGMVLCIP